MGQTTHEMPWRQEYITVDPDYAAELLAEHNTRNRPLDEQHARRLATEMTEGRWNEGLPDGIKLDTNFNILDGQHRLRAVVISGITVKMLVTYDLDPETFVAMDSIAKKRTAGDTLALYAGISKYRVNIGGALRLVKNWDNQLRNSGMSSQVSNTEILDFGNDFQKLGVDLEEYARVASRVRTKTRLSVGGTLAGLLMTTRATPGVDHTEWLTGLTTGANLSPGHPILALREYGMKNSAAGQSEEALPRYLKAWNSYIAETEIHMMRIGKSDRFIRPVEIPADSRIAADSITAFS